MKAFVYKNPMNGIGYQNTIPWKSDIGTEYFNIVTTGNGNNAVVLGYNTFKNMNYKPFPNRRNYIMTRCPEIVAESCGSDVIFEGSIENIKMLDSIFDEVYVVGGESMYPLFEPFYTEIYVIMVHNYTQIDTFFLVNLKKYEKHSIKDIEEKKNLLSFSVYTRGPLKKIE
jgi:dihydrofolate reductase